MIAKRGTNLKLCFKCWLKLRLGQVIRQGFLSVALSLLIFSQKPLPAQALNPNFSALLSSLFFPGTGQFSNGQNEAGAWQLGTALVLSSSIANLQESPDYIKADEAFDEDTNTQRINPTSLNVQTLGILRGNGLSLYSGYDAYRLARALPEYRLRYSRTPIPQDSLLDLSLAPFRLSNFTDLTVLVPLALAASLALGTPVDNKEDPSQNEFTYRREGGLSRNTLRVHNFISFNVVGMGEEAFFRGYLNTELVERLGTRWGVVMSGLIFGAAHNGKGGSAGFGSATIFGIYAGWMHIKNDYSLQEVVALHSWWDVLVTYRASKDLKELQIPFFSIANMF